MAKIFKLSIINSIEGTPYKIPSYDESGSVKVKDGKVETVDANLADILNLLIKVFPRDQLTMDNIIHGSRLKNQLLSASDVLTLEEAEHDWVKKVLRMDSIGPKIFGFSLVNILDALDQFERREK